MRVLVAGPFPPSPDVLETADLVLAELDKLTVDAVRRADAPSPTT